LFLSFGYIKPIQRHKPSQRRFLVFLLRLRQKKTKTKKKKKKEKERERIETREQKKIGKGNKAVVSSRSV
jgi:hypothetical protein